MLSKACEYAIRAMIFLAGRPPSAGSLNVRDVAKAVDAPAPFVAKILQELSRKGLVQSNKGPHGGFYLDEPSRKATLADVVLAVDGDALFTRCGLGLTQCNARKPCPLHHQFKPLREELHRMLKSARLSELDLAMRTQSLYLSRK